MTYSLEPIEAYHLIREACLRRPELRFRDWDYAKRFNSNEALKENPYLGFCYVATEVFCYLVPEARRRKCKSVNHHFAVIGDKVWDLTAEQFSKIIDYKNSSRVPRKQLTERATLLYEEVLELM